MNELSEFIGWVQDIGFIGLLIILAFPVLREKFGLGINSAAIIAQIEGITKGLKDEMKLIKQRLTKHLDDEEAEMREIRDHLAKNEKDMAYIKGKLEK